MLLPYGDLFILKDMDAWSISNPNFSFSKAFSVQENTTKRGIILISRFLRLFGWPLCVCYLQMFCLLDEVVLSTYTISLHWRRKFHCECDKNELSFVLRMVSSS